MIEIPDVIRDRLDAVSIRHAFLVEMFQPGRPEEMLRDGGMDVWDFGGGTPEYWSLDGTGATLALERVNRFRGLGCIRLDRVSGTDPSLRQSIGPSSGYEQRFVPGMYYLIRLWFRTDDTGTPLAEVELANTTRGVSVISTGSTWNTTPQTTMRLNPFDTDRWTYGQCWIYVDETFDLEDDYSLRLYADTVAVGQSMAFDEVSILGPFPGPAAYYSSRAATLGAAGTPPPFTGEVDYERLAVQIGGMRQELGSDTKSFSLTFSNVEGTLGALMNPVDLITGGLVIVRLGFLQAASDDLEPETVTLFTGKMQRPKQADAERLVIPVVSIADGFSTLIPRRRTSLWCPLEFADGVDCNYSSSTLANGAGAATTALVVDDGSLLVSGRRIGIGRGSDPVVIQSVAGNNVTLEEARTWADNDPVFYVDCNREFSDCVQRDRVHEFAGILGAENTGRLRNKSTNFGTTPESGGGRVGRTRR